MKHGASNKTHSFSKLAIYTIAWCSYDEITKGKEAAPMDNEPYIQHITQMLRRLPPDPLRAVYMMIKEYDVLVSSLKTE